MAAAPGPRPYRRSLTQGGLPGKDDFRPSPAALRSKKSPRRGRARKDYRLTAQGRKVLDLIRKQITELYDEVLRGVETKGKR